MKKSANFIWYYLEASKKVQDFVIFLLRLLNSPVIFVAFSKYIYEIQYEHSLQFVYFVYESFLHIDSILSWYNRMQVITLWLQIIINILKWAWNYLYYLEASKKVQDFVIFLLRLLNSPVIFVAFSKYIYEIQYEHSLQFVYFVYESFLHIDSILSWYNRMQVITLWLQIIINIFEGAWKYWSSMIYLYIEYFNVNFVKWNSF